MFDYTGHLVRAVRSNPGHVTGCLMNFRNAAWKRYLTESIGHQGHTGRVTPWNWERQYDAYFKAKDLEWQEVASYREEWHSHKRAWM
eukprot:1999137-Karenia_brevis.AAC.1